MKRFYSKVILFGEYSVLKDGQLLAFPFDHFSGALQYSYAKETDQTASNKVIQGLFNFISDKKFMATPDFAELNTAIEKGLWFNSNIPIGYGIGSSGALVAALYTQFFSKKNNLTTKQIQSDLAQIESYFHGSSSGSDPLVSYLNKPLIINRTLPKKFGATDFIVPCLIDTGQNAKTNGFVDEFLKIKDHKVMDLYIRQSNLCIDQYISGHSDILNSIAKLSEIQKDLFSTLFKFPKNIQNAISNTKLTTKLCGSGGGFLLTFVKRTEFAEISKAFHYMNIPFIPLQKL